MKWFGILGFLLSLALSQRLQAQTATVTWGTTHQTMDGFGGSTWLYQPVYTAGQLNLFFSHTAGIGYQIVRTSNDGCYINYNTTACPVATSSMPELQTVANAVLDGATVELTIAPPANLKYSGNFNNTSVGADGSCVGTSNFSALATFTVDWIEMMSANGAPVTYLFPFNEPNLNQSQIGACEWSAEGIDAYVKVLGPALASAGLGSIKIGIADVSTWFSPDLVSTCLNDSSCGQYVSIVSGHGYGQSGAPDGFTPQTGYCCNTASAAPSAASGKHIWMNEINGGHTYNSTIGLWVWDPSMADALVWARNIHDYLTVANVSGYEYWELADCCYPGEGTGPSNDGLTEQNGTTLSARYWVIGNWSKFIQPGWVRIDSTNNPQTGVYVTAFKNPAGTSYSIVALNSNSSATSQTFDLNGFSTTASVTPYSTTSSSAGLVELSSVAVSSSAFTYTLPAFSVTSFVGSTASASAKGPAPPTGLADSVQ
jgi:glucuronoarabinoxylan endo-1,4-beta-xylanase